VHGQPMATNQTGHPSQRHWVGVPSAP
jgi:hypothetical protein